MQGFYMAETRTEKYKKYRESLNEVKAVTRDGDFEIARKNRTVTDTTNTTSTLPIEEVLGKIDEHQEDETTRVLTVKKLRIGITIILGILLIAGIIIFAMIAFGGNN